MGESNLMLHCGARRVERGELANVPIPPSTSSWFPVGHETTVATVERSLTDAGFVVRSAKFGLSRGDARMFSVMDLETPLISGVSLAIGIRNSLDKSLPLGFCAGSRVFCCDNLAFRSELLVSRKHTANGATRFNEAICAAVKTLGQFQEQEVARIRRLQYRDLTETEAESLMLRAWDQGIVSHRLLPTVIKEWRQPSFAEFCENSSAWRLYNAFTAALMPRSKSNPQQHAALTMKIGKLLDTNGTDNGGQVPGTTAA